MTRILRGMPDRPNNMNDEWWDLCTPCWEPDPARRPNMVTLIHNIQVGKALLDHDDWWTSIADFVIMSSSRNPLMIYQVLYKFGVLQISLVACSQQFYR